jgi:PAS domain S-box-containing protein
MRIGVALHIRATGKPVKIPIMNTKKKTSTVRLKSADKLLHESELLHRQLLQGLPAATYTCDSKGRITFFNEAAAKLWGREPKIGVDLWCGSWKIYKTDGTILPLDTCPMGVALKEGRAVFGEEIVVERPNGERRNVLPHPRPIFDSNGKVIAAVNMLVDITDLKRVDQALRESEIRFRTVANTAPVLIWMTDQNRHCTFVNKGWLDFTGRSHEEEMGNGWLQAIHPEDIQNCMNIYATSFEARKNFYMEYRLRRHNGEYRWIASRGEPRYMPDGAFEGYVGSCTDINDTKLNSAVLEQRINERTKALNDAISQLERSNLELAQFAYVVTHDLQEPLRKVKTFTDRLMVKAGTKLANDEKVYLEKIKSSADRMSGLIKDVLHYSILTRSAEPFIKTDLHHIANHMLTDFELLIAQKKASIEIDPLPVIDAVHLQMNQLFNNLIGNSLKFTSTEVKPVIRISSAKVSAEEISKFHLQPGKEYVKLSFSDNGIGFSQEYAEQVFEIFQRLNGNDEYPGTGIGLALCKKIVVNHRGIVHAESTPGKGSTFHILLPVKQF